MVAKSSLFAAFARSLAVAVVLCGTTTYAQIQLPGGTAIPGTGGNGCDPSRMSCAGQTPGSGGSTPGTIPGLPGGGSTPGMCAPGNAGATCGGSGPASQGSGSSVDVGAGNPINIITGNKHQKEVDLPALPGVLGLEIVRYYNSAYSHVGAPAGILGRGWKLSYETDLYAVGRTVQIVQADGSRIIFNRDPNDPSQCASSNPAHGKVLIRQTSRGEEYTWVWTNGRKLSFNDQGRLVQILAPTGEFVSLQHDPKGHLLKVSDPQGRSLQLRYLDKASARNNDRFKGVTAIDSPVGQFRYDYGSTLPEGATVDKRKVRANLVKVGIPTHADANVFGSKLPVAGASIERIYHYEDAKFPMYLTGITVSGSGSDAKQIKQRIATWGYDTNGRAALSVRGEAARWQTDKEGKPLQPAKQVEGTGIEQVTLERPQPGTTILTNSLGQSTTYKHAIVGGEYRLLEVRGAGCASCGEVNVRYGYDRLGRLTETTQLNAQGQPIHTTKTELDPYGRTVKVSKLAYRNGKPTAPQLLTRYDYAAHKADELPSYQPTLIARPSVVAGKEHQLRITYNDVQQPVRVTESGWSPAIEGSDQAMPIERSTTYSYSTVNGRSLLAQIDGPLANGKTNSPADSDITQIRYDARGNYPTEIIAPGNQVSAIARRDEAGRPLNVIAPGGIELAYELDASGRIRKLTKAGVSEHLTYNALGQLAGVVQATGQRLYFTYRLDGRLSDIYDGQNNRIQIQRDAEGRLIARTLFNPDGSIAQQADLPRYIVDPEAPNASGQVHNVADELTDPHGNTTRIMRASDGMPEAVFEPGNIATRLTYDRQRRLVELADARNLKTGYVYDDFGRLVRVDSPDGGATVFAWNAADRLTGKTIGYGTAEAGTIEYRYDPAGRVAEQITPEGKTAIVYGQHGRPVSITFPTGAEQYSYDAAARLIAHTRIIDGNRFTTRYAYDERGQLTQKTLPDGQILTYHYNGAIHPKAGLLNAITRKDLFGKTVLLEGLNDAEDGYASQRYRLANGLDYVRQLDRTGHITRIGSPGAWEENHRRDAAGQLVERTPVGPAGKRNLGYRYDALGRLTSIGRAGTLTVGASAAAEDHRYSYDAGGNLLTQALGNKLTRYAVDARSNRILAAHVNGQTSAYAYNAAGSVAKIGNGEFTWDSQQRLVKVSDAGKPVAEYHYNPFGERIKKVVYANNQKKVTYFFYDGSQLTAEAEVNEGSARITRQYVWLQDQGGARPIALLQGRESRLGTMLGTVSESAGRASSTDVYAIVADHTGASRAVVGEGKQTVWQADITGYGQTILGNANQLDLNLRGSNQYFDEETGLHYNTRRYLDPLSGRYLSADPSGQAGGINLYTFANNNPIANIDPLGLQAKPVSQQSFQDKLKTVLGHAIDQLPGEIGNAFQAWVDDLPTTAAVLAVWGASHAFGIGFLADIALVGMAYYSLGSAAIDFVKGVIDLVEKINNAQCDNDLRLAGAELATVSIALAASVGNKGKSGGQAISSIFGGGKSKVSTTAPSSPSSGAKLVLHPTSIRKLADDIIVVGIKAGKLFQRGPNDWETVGGLRFTGLDGKGRNRVEHVAEHLTVAPGKPKQSIFAVPADKLFNTLDEAWSKRGAYTVDPKSRNWNYIVPMGRTVGAEGERSILIAVRPGTNQVVTAFPKL